MCVRFIQNIKILLFSLKKIFINYQESWFVSGLYVLVSMATVCVRGVKWEQGARARCERPPGGRRFSVTATTEWDFLSDTDELCPLAESGSSPPAGGFQLLHAEELKPQRSTSSWVHVGVVIKTEPQTSRTRVTESDCISSAAGGPGVKGHGVRSWWEFPLRMC